MQAQNLNIKPVATAGLVGGGITIVAATAYFFKVLSDPREIIELYEAVETHSDPNGAIARLVGAAIAVIGALTVSYVAAYVGKPAKPFTS